MCSISGIWEFNPKKRINPLFLRKMLKAMSHRGPDEEGIWVEKNIGIANKRLSIIDLETGHQPISNEDKTLWIVFNGEIYNFPQLRNKLIKKGHKFSTKTDTEIILHLYEEEGEKCLKKLDGMFAFALWDKKKKFLFLARDPLGQKPLHWTIFENKFVFSSEIKGILSYPGFKKEIDRQSLVKYLLYGFVPAPDSIFQGIKKLLPGYYMIVKKNGQIKEKQYWEIDYSKKIKIPKEEIKKETVKLLEKAVEKRLISDVPLGVFLSGGVDSGLVVAMMTKFILPSQIQAFSIGFKEKAFDESEFAEKTAKHLGIKHHLKIFSQKELLDLIPKVVNFLDEPMADPSILPTSLLASFTHKSLKVALSGDGGDESFAGYPKYLAHWFLEKIPKRLRNDLKHLSSIKFFPQKWRTFLRYASFPLYLRNQLWINPFSSSEVAELTGEEVSLTDLERYHQLFNGKNLLNEAFFLDQKLTLPDLYLVKTDRASMINSLEIRCPFLDKKLVEFTAQIPFELKLQGFRTKSLLREIALDFLPKEIVLQPKKGFGIPLKKWLNNDLKSLVEKELSSGKIEKEGILNSQKVKEILKQNNPQQIWTLLVFELWLKKWLKN